MTDLHWSLLALGAAIIVAVLAFNWMQERKFRNEATQRFVSPQADVLMDEFQFDPEKVLETQSNHALEPTFEPEQLAVELEGNHEASYDLDVPHIDQSQAEAILEEAFEKEREYEAIQTEPYVQVAQSIDSEAAPHVANNESNESEALLRETGLPDLSNHLQESPIEAQMIDESHQSQESVYQKSRDEMPESEVDLPDAVDPLVDLVGVLYFPKTSLVGPLREFLLALTDLDKPIFAYALSPDHIWHLVTRDFTPESYQKVVCSVQLADRSGYISKSSLNRFQNEVDKLSKKLAAQVEWQTHSDPWKYASELDQFCIDVDKMVGFHLTQGVNGPFTGTKFRGLVEANGLLLDEEGYYYKMSDQGLRLYSVHNHDNVPFSPEMLRTSVIRGVVFKLDIPRVKNCPEIFNQMAITGQLMANTLSANFVDDNKRPVGETQLEIVRHQLRVIHSKMVARGIVPGSPTALRLFS